MPRWAAAPLAEFVTPSARAGFVRNKEAIIGSFADRLAESEAHIAVLNDLLPVLDELIRTPSAVNGELSEDDIHLFATLRAMSIVRGIAYPAAVNTYRTEMTERTGVDLHDAIAS